MPNKTQRPLAGCHSISCKWFSHKQHGFRLKRMVAEFAGARVESQGLVEPVLEARDFEMIEPVEP